jgi:SAM-dependent methyltransferase
MSYYSAVVQRHLEATRSSIPLRALATEQMSPMLDPLSLKFALCTRASSQEGLDIGCGDGLAAAAALARGGHVMAVDPDQAALHSLLARIPSEQYRRLKVRQGSLPALDFKFAHFSAVHAARVLHVLEPESLQESLRKFFRWLYPNGKLFLSVLTPSGSFWRRFHVEFSKRSMGRDPWPGYIEDVGHFLPRWTGAASSVHLLDEGVLRRELVAAGFLIEEVSCYPLPWDNEQICCAVIARCES